MNAKITAIENVKQIAMDAYLVCNMGGHDYAYKAGYARAALYRILMELNAEFETEGDDE